MFSITSTQSSNTTSPTNKKIKEQTQLIQLRGFNQILRDKKIATWDDLKQAYIDMYSPEKLEELESAIQAEIRTQYGLTERPKGAPPMDYKTRKKRCELQAKVSRDAKKALTEAVRKEVDTFSSILRQIK
jgi:hypothetical protein